MSNTRGFACALLAALSFGAATPASKPLVESLGPVALAGLLYLGAALGALPFALGGDGLRAIERLDRRNALRLAGAIVLGGVIGPLLLLAALERSSAASVSLASGLEGPLTAVLGALLFRDALGRLGWIAVGLASLSGALLAGGDDRTAFAPTLMVAAACVAWALDNHLTALLDGVVPAAATFAKGLAAGLANLAMALLLDARAFGSSEVAAALAVGALGYGLSITLYVTAAQQIGATRAQTVFAAAPFLGALVSFAALGEPLAAVQVLAALLLASAIALLMKSAHEHVHAHEAFEHVHAHRHDDGHHGHAHPDMASRVRHSHRHAHEPVVHSHPHQPDLHHRHPHRGR